MGKRKKYLGNDLYKNLLMEIWKKMQTFGELDWLYSFFYNFVYSTQQGQVK